MRHDLGAGDLEPWVRYSCARRGCSCEPTVTVVTEGRLTRASVAHDQDCPAIAEVA